jgi:hypothetical protein
MTLTIGNFGLDRFIRLVQLLYAKDRTPKVGQVMQPPVLSPFAKGNMQQRAAALSARKPAKTAAALRARKRAKTV